jgi:hypothetical protein
MIVFRILLESTAANQKENQKLCINEFREQEKGGRKRATIGCLIWESARLMDKIMMLLPNQDVGTDQKRNNHAMLKKCHQKHFQ